MNPQDNIKKAAEIIQASDAILICAGAGMGVDSGLPDFRGNEGFWNAYPPYRKKGIPFTGMANPQWFENDPPFAWGFYGHRLNLYRDTTPHRGFTILSRWGKSKKNTPFIFTSNVDGQFQKAGFNDSQIVECHGSIHHLQCIRPCENEIWSADGTNVEVDFATMRAGEQLPLCNRCGSLARPNILMFGDWMWISQRSDSQGDRFNRWLTTMENLVIIECGAGTGVPTVRYTSENLVRKLNARLIRINVREPEVPSDQIGIAGGALEILEQIDGHLQ